MRSPLTFLLIGDRTLCVDALALDIFSPTGRSGLGFDRKEVE